MLTRRQLLQRTAAASVTTLALSTASGLALAAASPALTAAAQGAPSQYALDLGGYKGPPPSAQPVSLRLTRQLYPPFAENWWKDMYSQWAAAYPNITFREELVPYGDLNQKLQTYVAAGDPPDVIMGKGDFVQAYAFNNIALNLSDYLTDDFLADIPTSVAALQMVNGKLYAWPYVQGQCMLYFNKDLFARAGVATPPELADVSQTWTWTEFQQAMLQLQSALNPGGDISIYPMGASEYGNGGPGSSYWYEGAFIRSQGDPLATPESTAYRTFAGISADGLTTTGYVDTPEAIAGMQFYQSLFTQKLTPSVPASSMFESQQAVTKFGNLSQGIHYDNGSSPLDFNWGVTPIPRGNILFTHTSGDAPIISSKSKYAAEAAAFCAFIHNDTNRISWHSIWGEPPARTSLWAKMGYTKPFQLMGEALTKVGYAPPITPGYLEYFSAMNTAVKDIALGANPADRLHTVAGQIDGLLGAYKV